MSSVQPLCKSTESKSIATDRRWKRKQASRSSPERLPNLRPSSPRNSRDEELKAPKFSIAIGWNIWSEYMVWRQIDEIRNCIFARWRTGGSHVGRYILAVLTLTTHSDYGIIIVLLILYSYYIVIILFGSVCEYGKMESKRFAAVFDISRCTVYWVQ